MKATHLLLLTTGVAHTGVCVPAHGTLFRVESDEFEEDAKTVHGAAWSPQ